MQCTLVVSILASSTALALAEPPPPTLDSDPLGVVTFASGSSRVMPAARDRIEEIAAWHADHPDSMLFVEGYASSAGSWNKNLVLSQDRADAVRSALVRAGADPARMVLAAHSENEADAAESSNRRVVIRATGSFPELAREQRDPETSEDARAEGRMLDQTSDEDEEATRDERGAIGGTTTVVIVPTGGGGEASSSTSAPPIYRRGASATTEIGTGGPTAIADADRGR